MKKILGFPPSPLRWRSLLAPLLSSLLFTYFNLLSELNFSLLQLTVMTAVPAYFLGLLFGLPSFMLLGKWVTSVFIRLCIAGFLCTFLPVFALGYSTLSLSWHEWRIDTWRAMEGGLTYGLYGLSGGVFAWLLSVPIEEEQLKGEQSNGLGSH